MLVERLSRTVQTPLASDKHEPVVVLVALLLVDQGNPVAPAVAPVASKTHPTALPLVLAHQGKATLAVLAVKMLVVLAVEVVVLAHLEFGIHRSMVVGLAAEV